MSLRRRPMAASPSLVPLADMLTNTLGIVIFVMVFTVLAAGGATLPKRLPMERRSDATPIHFVCRGGQVYHLDMALVDRLIDGTRTLNSIAEFKAWRERANGRTASSHDVGATLHARFAEFRSGSLTFSQPEITVAFELLDGGGEPMSQATLPDSRFSRLVRAADPQRRFVHFFVLPDGIDAFNAARDSARRQGLRTGWMPQADGQPIVFSLQGHGRDSTTTD